MVSKGPETQPVSIFSINNNNKQNNNNNGNFFCVFECTIINLGTYRRFTNAAWDWIIQRNKTKQNKIKKEKKKEKQTKQKEKTKLH